MVEVNLWEHNGEKPPHVKSAIWKQDLRTIVFQHAWCMWGNLVQMFLMTPHGESMCALIDFIPAIPSISIKACNVKIFNHCKASNGTTLIYM